MAFHRQPEIPPLFAFIMGVFVGSSLTMFGLGFLIARLLTNHS